MTIHHGLNINKVLVHSNFSENYSMKYLSEIQVFHFGCSRTLHTPWKYLKKDKHNPVVSQSNMICVPYAGPNWPDGTLPVETVFVKSCKPQP